MISELPDNSYFTLTGIGEHQNSMTALASLLANGVRIGIEDNIWYDSEKTILATNYSLLNRVVNIAKAYDRQIATPTEVREMLNLNK